MYANVCETGELCVWNENREIVFSLGRMILHKDDGQEITLDYEMDGWPDLSAEAGNGQGGISFIQDENLIAVHMEGTLKKNIPSFGYQPSLADQKGVGLDLRFAQECPFLAVYQHKEWWIRPFFGKVCCEIPPKTQLLVRRCNDEYEILLAVCGKNCRADLEGTECGVRITLSSNLSNQMHVEDLAVVYARGREPYQLVEDAVSMALRLSEKRLELRKYKKYPEIFEKTGWCTWDSLGQQVNEKAIFDKMDEFKELGLPISWVLIDDGWSWADMENLRLRGLDADSEKFPRGLAHTIRVLKEKYHVSYVGVWQGIKGYWHGIEEGSKAEHMLAKYLLKYPNGEITMQPEPEKAFGFWNTWHSYLKKNGVDFIKVDSQSSYSLCSRGVGSYGQAAAAIHTGLEASADMNFGGNLINCMGMAPENVWNRQSAVLSRNSDDFFPRLKGSFQEHALQNCYNSVYHGCFYWEDWDMAWSKHEDGKQNLMLRMISGGPVYFSDGLGNTDPLMIWPMILEDGTVLRCEDVGRPTIDCLTEDVVGAGKPLKVYNRYGDTVYVAAFGIVSQDQGSDEQNLRAERTIPTMYGMSGIIQRSDFPVELPSAYWIYDWGAQTAVRCGSEEEAGGKEQRKMSEAGKYEFFVAPGDAALFHIIPEMDKIQMVGILEKYMSGICVERILKEEHEYLVILKCEGTFGFLTREQVREVRYNGKTVSFERQGDLYRVICHGGNGILQIKF